jgi:hypothetical protein
MMGRVLQGVLAAAALAGLAAVPAVASTVRAGFEVAGTRVALADEAGEVNRLKITVPENASEVRFRDASSRIEAEGKRCAEQPGPAFRVDCRLDGEVFFEIGVDAGAGDDEITSDVAKQYGLKASSVHLAGGQGEDLIETAGAEDNVDPGTGEDTVRSGAGYDFISAGPQDDGPDSYDGGAQGATISYEERELPVRVRLDGLANDGAEGEGDSVRRTFGVTGGGAGDRMTGDHHRNYLFGGAGADRLRGRGEADAIVGEAGSDRIHAGKGDDWVLDRGTAGADFIDCGPGRDLYEADSRDEVIDCEIPLFGSRRDRAKSEIRSKR